MLKLVISFLGAMTLLSCATPLPGVKSDMDRNVDDLHARQDKVTKPIDYQEYQRNNPNNPINKAQQKN